MLENERERLRAQRLYQDAELTHKQLQFLLGRLNSYLTLGTLVTGFSFSAFSADALHELPYELHPVRSMIFSCSAAVSMSLAVSVVWISQLLMAKAERLSMTTSPHMAVAALRKHMPVVNVLFFVSIVGLFVAASSLLFAMCRFKADGSDEHFCPTAGVAVMVIFVVVSSVTIAVARHIDVQFNTYRRRLEGGMSPRSPLRDALLDAGR